ncbi:intein-containing DNA-directed DNA polymerase [Thermococcus indicus]|uniref:DNA polymerase n=1 Tax=Thermococcus indicus TaxID=2586643 RepID=A0A4Y5SJ02_9EURY|nr:DNA polymerase domain-containing protein [Thermococcus indicus]QDA30705.1 intein-containing DNA-directed DNA polymerase [Thermococcus indicus]
MILDTDYITEGGKPVIRIFKKENGEFKIEYDRTFEPYFYALLKDDSAIEDVKKITAKRHGTVVKVKRAEKVQKKFLGRPIEVWKLYFTHPQDVPAIRDKIREHPAVVDIYEYDIPFAKRYLIDKGLVPMEGDEELKMLAFDIETLYHEGEEFAEGPILMISYADENEARVITWKKIYLPYVDVVSTEKEMIKHFLRVVKEKDPDVLITYNGDNFDFAYLKKRSEKLGIKFVLGRDGSEPKIQRMGDRFAVEVKGRIHFDLYPVIRRTINLPTYTLEAVYEAIFGKPKEKVYAEEIAQAWESGEGLERVARYSMEDARVTFELGREFFPMEAQLSRLIGQSLWDVSRSSTGNLVEWFLLRKAYERNELAPNKPDERELARRRESYAGGYVKEPERGLWDNIVYLDFRCHPADTKVIVKGRGAVNISEVREGDYVLGIDGWQRVKKVWEYDYDGELININGLRCTPNHKLPVVGKNERQTRIRDNLAKSFLTGKVKGKLITTPLFEKIGELEKEEVPEEEILKGELVGILLAEGTLIRRDVEYFDSSRGKKRISHQYRVEITIGKHEEEFQKRIIYILEKLFGVKPNISQKKGTNAVTIKVAKKDVYLKVKELVDNVENLHAPSVLRGFFEGDGTVNKARRTIVANQGTKNKWKIDIISKLLERLGIPHSMYTYEYTEKGKPLTRYLLEITGRDGLILFQTLVGFISTEKNQALSEAIRSREMNRLGDNAFYHLSDFKATTEYYKGKVYDLTLEGTPYYFANGILTHNSLYPSIIITHNVSPDTLNREGCRKYDTAPQVGHRFCKDFPGFIPSLLGDLLEERQKIKRKMKASIDPLERKLLDYRQRAIKILANSVLPEEWIPIAENGRVKLLRIGEFVDGLMENEKGRVRREGDTEVLEVSKVQAISFDRKTKKARTMPVKAVIRHRYSGDVYEIVLSSGRRIRITGGHSLFAYRNDELVEVTGEEIKPGDFLAVPRRVNLPERRERFNLIELLLELPEEETEDIVMTIPVKGRKNFFRGMLRTLRWISGEEKRPRTARRYLEHLEKLGYVRLKKIGYEVLDWGGLERYRTLYERLVEAVRYNGNRREYLLEFNAVRDVVSLMPEEELKEWKIGTRNGFRIGPFIDVNEDFAKLLGYYVSEGYARKHRNQKNGWSYTVKLYNENQRVLDDMERLARKFFGRVKRGRNYVEILRKMAYIIFENLCGTLAENKRIPEVIFTSPESVRWAFLEGYFIGDGDVHPNKRVRLSTKSELLVNGLVLLINSLGVSGVKIRYDSGVYRIYVNEELPFTDYSKKKNVYYSHVIPKEVLEDTFGKAFQRNMSHEKFRELVESGKLNGENAKRIEWLLNGDVVLDKVGEVRKLRYRGYVYDLSVEEDENFLAGFGFLYAHNSYYGYYGYARARWYCKECAESVTAWGRDYIEMVIRELEEKFGFKVLYADTDGLHATIPGADDDKVKKKAMEFLKYINPKLPGLLELEYEGFYLRGFFVTKKKYAVIDEEGKITTRGLEIVRRDWSEIAKETQARVLEAILRHGDVEEAVRIVKEITEKLSKYEVPPEKLVIHEQITRELKDYKATGPHVAIAKRLAAMGIKIRPGTVISYIVLKGSGRIGDRAIPFDEFDPTKHKYDAEYYIENQVLPAVERILKAFGYKKDDLRYQKTRQVGLGAWLKPKGKK